MVIIQRLMTLWQKRKRDVTRDVREAFPSACALPAALLACDRLCFHHGVTRVDANHYLASERWLECDQPGSCLGFTPSISLQPSDAGLEIAFVWRDECGLPKRSAWRTRVKAGAWARILYNGRFESNGVVRYEEKVLNIAFEMNPSQTLFERTTPAFVMDTRADLK